MGGSGSKVTSAAPQAWKAAESVTASVAKAAKRKIQKEGRQFMASERAEKELNKQQKVPKRAPLNLGRATIGENVRKTREEEIEEMQKHDSGYVNLMKDVYVSSTDPDLSTKVPLEVHSGKRSEELEKKLPKMTKRPIPSDNLNIPRGRAQLKMIIEALYNHRMNPQDWGPAEIAEKLRLRESDTKDVLKYFELLEGTSILRARLPYDSK